MAKSGQNIDPNTIIYVFLYSKENLRQVNMLRDYIWAISYFLKKNFFKLKKIQNLPKFQLFEFILPPV